MLHRPLTKAAGAERRTVGSRDRWKNYALESGLLRGWGVKGPAQAQQRSFGIATGPLPHAAPLYEGSSSDMSDSRHLGREATLSCLSCCRRRAEPLRKCPIRDIGLASHVKQAQRSLPIGRWAPSTKPSDKNRKNRWPRPGACNTRQVEPYERDQKEQQGGGQPQGVGPACQPIARFAAAQGLPAASPASSTYSAGVQAVSLSCEQAYRICLFHRDRRRLPGEHHERTARQPRSEPSATRAWWVCPSCWATTGRRPAFMSRFLVPA